jgi:hypothetical protein
LMLLPELAYAGVFVLSFDHGLSILTGGAAASAELFLVVLLIRRPRNPPNA